MFDIALTDTIASALASALNGSIGADDFLIGAGAFVSSDPEGVARVCRRAARTLLFEMRGSDLLDLALAKLAAEGEMRMDTAAVSGAAT